MTEQWDRLVARWLTAGVMDEETAARIRAFEAGHASSARWRWPMWLALAFGALMLGAGVLLFVSAHWDAYSPSVRFVMVLSMVGLFHIAGTAVSARAPALATSLHAVGTVACGAGIFLSGQIFNLAEHWPSGILLWALAAIFGWVLLRQWPQLALAALLTPAWIEGEWQLATRRAFDGSEVATAGAFLLALAYFSAPIGDRPAGHRRVLTWIGAITLLPCALSLAIPTGPDRSPTISAGLMTMGWIVALGAPTLLAAILRRADAWPNLLAAGWVVSILGIRPMNVPILLYVWWALGAAALTAWGIRDRRSERINMGAAIFAGTVVAFYFSEIMIKLDRSVSLIGLGVLFLAGGWALERARRHVVRRTKGEIG